MPSFLPTKAHHFGVINKLFKILNARARARECKMARKTGNAWASKQRASIARTFLQSPEVHYPRLSHQSGIRKYFPALIVRNEKKRSKGLPFNKLIYTFGAHNRKSVHTYFAQSPVELEPRKRLSSKGNSCVCSLLLYHIRCSLRHIAGFPIGYDR